MDEQIVADEQKLKLEKEIARLEKQARNEKQPKKKFELVQMIKKLRKILQWFQKCGRRQLLTEQFSSWQV